MSDHPAAAATGADHRLQPIRDQLSHALIALDFDGTLSAIVPDPMQARPVPGAVDTLIRLAEAGAQVAVVTGRDAITVEQLGGLRTIPRVLISGLHGAELWQDGQLRTRDEPAGLAELRQLLPPLLPPGVWLEDKRLSLVLHARRAPDPQHALAELQATIPPIAAEHGLEAHPGKLVIEIRIPGLSKATALKELLGPGVSAALFAGDDLGDLPAVQAIRRWREQSGRPAVTVSVGEVAELQAVTDLQLSAPRDLADLLAGLLAR
jgi:trehalose 6-phosphate phosphatase